MSILCTVVEILPSVGGKLFSCLLCYGFVLRSHHVSVADDVHHT